MLTGQELIYAILVPVLVSAAIAGLGMWRGWAWAMPVAVGAGFMTAYVLLTGVPRLPPRDGIDWLFWAAVPVTLLGALDAATRSRWGWIFGAAAGGVALLVARPLVPGAVSTTALWTTAAALAAAGAALCYVARSADRRVGAWAVIGSLCAVTGAAAVVVLSSNLRIGGVYGIAAAAALGPVAVLAVRGTSAAGGVAVVAVSLLAGLLVGGHYYPDPGVGWTPIALLLTAPLLLAAAAALPGERNVIRGAAAVAAVAIAVGAVAAPIALEAKAAAEGDPYASYTE